MRLSEENTTYLNQILKEAIRKPELTFEGYQLTQNKDELLLQALSSLQLIYVALDEYENPEITEMAERMLNGWRHHKHFTLDVCVLTALKMASLSVSKLILDHRLNQ